MNGFGGNSNGNDSDNGSGSNNGGGSGCGMVPCAYCLLQYDVVYVPVRPRPLQVAHTFVLLSTYIDRQKVTRAS